MLASVVCNSPILDVSAAKSSQDVDDEVDRLRKARTVYIQRHQEWERCRDAARIAEQGAEIGATGENKVS